MITVIWDVYQAKGDMLHKIYVQHMITVIWDVCQAKGDM